MREVAACRVFARVDKVTRASPHPCSILEEIGPWRGGGEEKLGDQAGVK